MDIIHQTLNTSCCAQISHHKFVHLHLQERLPRPTVGLRGETQKYRCGALSPAAGPLGSKLVPGHHKVTKLTAYS